MAVGLPDPIYFARPNDLRRWFLAHHASATVLWVGYYKKEAGVQSIDWAESVDQALCFGWIDGIRKAVDETRFTIRFTPRKPGSIWSAVNIRRAAQLIDLKLMQPSGLASYNLRRDNKSGDYSYEQRSVDLPERYAAALKANHAAWQDYQARPPSYRKAANWWVISAKTEATREKRLRQLIDDHAHGRKIGPLRRAGE